MKRILIIISMSMIVSSCMTSNNLLPTTTITNTPIPTILSTTTPEETDSVFVISEDALNTIPPEDIISETEFYPGGNGGGRGECSEDQPKEVEKMELIEINLCLPDPDQDIFVKIIKPDGSIVAKKVIWQSIHSKGLFSYKVPWDGQAGKYSFIFNGIGFDNIEYEILVVQPIGPRMYYGSYLYQFLPYERIRILIYTPFDEHDNSRRTFLGWTTIIADKNGSAIFGFKSENDYEAISIAAVGEYSGQVLSEPYGTWGSGDIYCEGALNPQRSIGTVITTKDIIGYGNIDEYSSPVLIPEGTRMGLSTHMYGVKCKDHIFWYFAYIYDGLWVPEGKDGVYFFRSEN